jgi:hypothetical protein
VIFDTKIMGVCLPHSTYPPSNFSNPAGESWAHKIYKEGVYGWKVPAIITMGRWEVDSLPLVLNFAFLNFSIESQLRSRIFLAETCTEIHKDLGTVGLNVFDYYNPSVAFILATSDSKPRIPPIFSFIYGEENKLIIGRTHPDLEFVYINVVVAVCLYLCLYFSFDFSYIGEKLGYSLVCN